MAATYRAVMLTKKGGLDALQIVTLPVQPPGPKQLRIRVCAAGVGGTDLLMLGGRYLYASKIPFVPGYEVAGVVDAIGPGVSGFELGQRVAALTIYGGFAELLVREAEHSYPFRKGSPIDYRAGPLNTLVRALEPQSVDYSFDAVGGANVGPCIDALRKGGIVVGFGFVGAAGMLAKLGMFANLFIGARLRGPRGAFYGISALYKKDPKPLREDLPKIFTLMAERKLTPVISRTFRLLEAKEALALLASGSVEGKIVLSNT